jgi:hypothetical protein
VAIRKLPDYTPEPLKAGIEKAVLADATEMPPSDPESLSTAAVVPIGTNATNPWMRTPTPI